MNPKIQKIILRLQEDMIDFMNESGASYTQNDVESCIKIINDYLKDIEKTTTKEQGMTAVKKAVIALNELNEKCGDVLIETGQREDICEIIIIAGNAKGYNELTDDITEEWRMW